MKIQKQRACQSGTFLTIKQQYLPLPGTTPTATAMDETVSKNFSKLERTKEKFNFSIFKYQTTCSSRQNFWYLSNVLTGTNNILYCYPVPYIHLTNCTYRTQYMYHVQSNPTTLISNFYATSVHHPSVRCYHTKENRPSVCRHHTKENRPSSPYKRKTT